MGGGGNDPEFWGGVFWHVLAIVGAYILAALVFGALLFAVGRGLI